MKFNDYIRYTHIIQSFQRWSFKVLVPILYLWTIYVLHSLHGIFGLLGGLIPILSTIAAVPLALAAGHKAFPFSVIGFTIYAIGLPVSMIVFRQLFVTHEKNNEK